MKIVPQTKLTMPSFIRLFIIKRIFTIYIPSNGSIVSELVNILRSRLSGSRIFKRQTAATARQIMLDLIQFDIKNLYEKNVQ